MGNAFGGPKGEKTIQYSEKYYNGTDIALCTCTPPTEICVYGSVCFWPLLSVTKTKMRLLEQASEGELTFLRHKPGDIVHVKKENGDVDVQGKAIVKQDIGDKYILVDFTTHQPLEGTYTEDQIESYAQYNAYHDLRKLQEESTCCCGEIKTEGFYCKGWTSQTVMNIISQQALNSIGNNNDALGSLYQAAAVLKMRRQLRKNNVAGGCTDFIESTVCCGCVNCNNAYVVNNAVKEYLTKNDGTNIAGPPTLVNEQPGSVKVSYKRANRELDFLLF